MIKINSSKPRHNLFYRVLNSFFSRMEHLSNIAKVSCIAARLKSVGVNVIFDHGIIVNRPDNISIGKETFIGRNVYLNAYSEIEIGEFCGIAAGCKLISGNHDANNRNIELQNGEMITSPIKLGDGVWLGYDSIVLPGVTLGKGCVVAAGSVVTKSFDDFSVIGGVPAKLIKIRCSSGH